VTRFDEETRESWWRAAQRYAREPDDAKSQCWQQDRETHLRDGSRSTGICAGSCKQAAPADRKHQRGSIAMDWTIRAPCRIRLDFDSQPSSYPDGVSQDDHRCILLQSPLSHHLAPLARQAPRLRARSQQWKKRFGLRFQRKYRPPDFGAAIVHGRPTSCECNLHQSDCRAR
jgi:hypothetical protein